MMYLEKAMKRSLFTIALLCAAVSGCGVNTFVTKTYFDSYEIASFQDEEVEPQEGTQHDFHGWDVSVRCVAADEKHNFFDNADGRYLFSVGPHWVSSALSRPDSSLFTVESLEVMLLPENADTVLISTEPTKRSDSKTSYYAVYFDWLYLPETVDSIRVSYELQYTNMDIDKTFDTTFEYTMYRFEDKKRQYYML